MLFAQAAPPGGPPPNLQWIMAGAFAFCGLILIVYLVVVIFFLLTLSKALARCHPDNRTMSPGQVWLNLIPCFNLVWQFITVIRLGDSLKTEFVDRRLDDGSDYGKTLGLATILVALAGSVIQQTAQFAMQNNQQAAVAVLGVSGLINLADLALFIIYWIKIAGYGRELAADDRDRYEDDEADADPLPPDPAAPPQDDPHAPPQ